jgi:hypothetical protein
MKKILLVLFVIIGISVTGCGNTGKYKEGTYFGADLTTKDMAVVYVDNTGKIKSVFIDAVYAKCSKYKVIDNSCNITTKQVLKEEYGMKNASAVKKEWYEQANAFSEKVVKEQGLDWVGKIATDATELNVSTIDGVSSVTMDALGVYKAINIALEQAKK